MAKVALKPTKLWWLIGLVLFGLCLVLQLPARWLVEKFVPNNPMIQQVSGNIWQGQISWQIAPRPNTPLAGTLQWQWQPWHLITGKFGANVVISTGQTKVNGQIKVGKNQIQANEFSGKITPDTLNQFINGRLPETPIVIKNLTLHKDNAGFQQANGELSWAGGELAYVMGGKSYPINLPNMVGTLANKKGGTNNAQDNSNTTSRLHLALSTPQGQRLGDFYLDNDKMLDVELTQRLLKNMPSYRGNGADDSVVVSLRQPLMSMQ